MNCIIVDDEPLGRKAVQLLVAKVPFLKLLGSFCDAASASDFMNEMNVDLIFLDIRMPEVDGIEFAKSLGKNTLVIFTTAFAEYALDSYEVDAIDYLVKPIETDRFQKAVEKALVYHELLSESTQKESIESVAVDFMFVKSDRRYFKVAFNHILFIEGLKDYSVIQLEAQRIITRMNLKTIHELLPAKLFLRVNKSYIVNTAHISSFDNNDVCLDKYEIPIGTSYRNTVLRELLSNRVSTDKDNL